MDEDWLDQEVDEWVRDGIVSDRQAYEIRDRYGLTDPDAPPPIDKSEPPTGSEEPAEDVVEEGAVEEDAVEEDAVEEDAVEEGAVEEDVVEEDDERDTRGRIVTALSLMGAALIGVGIVLFLAAQWDAIPRPVRLGILVGSTGAFLGGGLELRHRRARPRVGHVLLGIGAVAIGVTLFGGNDLYSVTDNAAVLLAGWSVLGLVVAHGVRSKPIVLIALVPGLFAVADGVTGTPTLYVGLFALSIYGVSLLVSETRWHDLGGAYRLGSIAATIGVLLLVLLGDVNLRATAPDVGPVLGVLAVTAAMTVIGTAYAAHRDRIPIPAAVWTTTAFLVLGVTIVVSTGSPDAFPDLVRVLGWNAMVLGLILATVWLGYVDRSPRLVNGAVVAFLLQLFAVFVSTVLEAVSASVALIVGGIVLLAVGAALERGRRELLARMAETRHR